MHSSWFDGIDSKPHALRKWLWFDRLQRHTHWPMGVPRWAPETCCCPVQGPARPPLRLSMLQAGLRVWERQFTSLQRRCGDHFLPRSRTTTSILMLPVVICTWGRLLEPHFICWQSSLGIPFLVQLPKKGPIRKPTFVSLRKDLTKLSLLLSSPSSFLFLHSTKSTKPYIL